MERRTKIGIVLISCMIVLAVFLQNCTKAKEKEADNAFITLEKLVKAEPTNVSLIVRLAKLYQFNGQPQKAIELLKQKMKQIPDNPMLEIWYANAESMMASQAEKVQDKVKWSQFAIGDLDQTVEKYPTNWYVRFIRGKNSLNWPDMFHRTEVAIQDFEYLLQYNDQNPNAIPDSLMADIMYSLAGIYKNQPKTKDKADELYRNIVQKYPNTEEASKIQQVSNGKNS